MSCGSWREVGWAAHVTRGRPWSKQDNDYDASSSGAKRAPSSLAFSLVLKSAGLASGSQMVCKSAEFTSGSPLALKSAELTSVPRLGAPRDGTRKLGV